MDSSLVALIIPVAVGILVVLFFAASLTSIGPAESASGASSRATSSWP